MEIVLDRIRGPDGTFVISYVNENKTFKSKGTRYEIILLYKIPMDLRFQAVKFSLFTTSSSTSPADLVLRTASKVVSLIYITYQKFYDIP